MMPWSNLRLLSTPRAGEAGQLYTLGLLEELRAECKTLWGASSDAYFRVD
jgi:hypothetical protein